MKKIFTLLVIALTSIQVMARDLDGVLSITQIGKANYLVEVDGRIVNDRNGEIFLDNMAPGKHFVQVYYWKETRSRGWFRNDRQKQFIYNNAIYVKPRTHTDIIINRFGKVFVDENMINDVYDRRDGDRDRDWDRDRDRGRDYDRDNRDGYFNAMDLRSFEMLVQTMKRESFDNGKTSIAFQAIDRNYFTSEQVKQLMNTMSFDKGKVEVAKAAYRKTIDKNNFFIVYDALSFSSSKAELVDFVRTSK